MDLKQVLRNYDYDLPLMDALNDPELSPDRRVLAGATIGVCLGQAYFAVSELEEAFALLADDNEHDRRVGEGYLAMEAVLEGRHDYQMRLWHLVNEVSLDQAVSDLRWLKVLVHQRGQMTTTMAGAGLDPRYWTGEEGREGKSAAELMARVMERR